tara:strand:+ start:201 stop:755 length:555 start_codon:yes stop_codon:yes gene_type:complete
MKPFQFAFIFLLLLSCSDNKGTSIQETLLQLNSELIALESTQKKQLNSVNQTINELNSLELSLQKMELLNKIKKANIIVLKGDELYQRGNLFNAAKKYIEAQEICPGILRKEKLIALLKETQEANKQLYKRKRGDRLCCSCGQQIIGKIVTCDKIGKISDLMDNCHDRYCSKVCASLECDKKPN